MKRKEIIGSFLWSAVVESRTFRLHNFKIDHFNTRRKDNSLLHNKESLMN